MPKKTSDDIKLLLDREWSDYQYKKATMLALVAKIRHEFWRDNQAQFRRVERLENTFELMTEKGMDPIQAFLSSM